MGGKSSKAAFDPTVHWQILVDSKWQALGRESSNQIERGYQRSKEESVYILDDDSENPGDQVLYGGDLAQRLGGRLIYRHKLSRKVSHMRRVLISYEFASTTEVAKKPTILSLDETTSDVARPNADALREKMKSATLLSADTVAAILAAQYGSTDIQPLGPDDPPLSLVDVVDSTGRRLNLRNSQFGVDTLIAFDADQPDQGSIGQFLRCEIETDGTRF